MDYPGYVADAATMNNSTYDADNTNIINVNNRNSVGGSVNVAGSRGVKYNNAGPDGQNG